MDTSVCGTCSVSVKPWRWGEIGVWPWGVDFRQVHSPALRLLKGQDRTGQGGRRRRRRDAICALSAVTHTNSRSNSKTHLRPSWPPYPTPLPRSLPYPSLTGMRRDNRTVLVLGLASPWPHTGPDRRTKVHLAPLSTTSSTLGANT